MKRFRRGQKMRRQVWVFLVPAFLVIWGCAEEKKFSAPPPEVSVLTVEPRVVTITAELAGRTVPYRVADVRPQVNGIILKRYFTEGNLVKAGEILYQIDPKPFQTALENAEAALARSEASLAAAKLREERLRGLVAEKAVSQQDYDDALAVLKQIEADIKYWRAMVEQAKINLGYTSVKAPISGLIGRSNVTEGALVTAHQPMALATIQQLDPIYVDVPQSTTEVLKLRRELEERKIIRAGESLKRVQLKLEDGSDYPWFGTLQFQDVTVEQTTGSVVLRVVFPNPRNILLPGMFVRAVIERGKYPRAMLCPQQAVMRNTKGEAYTYVVNERNVIEMRVLNVEQAIGDRWLVSSGLSAGERVVMEGIQRVRPGMTVRIVPFTPPAKTAR
ncbi:MAG: efflux RND transporter periplasmic adaptor subunit [Syntrophales bacterium]|nr:efflux RND transporter periplasmic adaptor subunit [Syntrophales bacterium]